MYVLFTILMFYMNCVQHANVGFLFFSNAEICFIIQITFPLSKSGNLYKCLIFSMF